MFHEASTNILPDLYTLTECLGCTRKSPLMLPLTTRKPVEHHLEKQACWLVASQKLVSSCALVRNSYQLPFFAGPPFQWFHGFFMAQFRKHFWHPKVSHEKIFNEGMATSSAMKISVTRLGGIQRWNDVCRGCWTQKELTVGQITPKVPHVLSLVSLLCELNSRPFWVGITFSHISNATKKIRCRIFFQQKPILKPKSKSETPVDDSGWYHPEVRETERNPLRSLPTPSKSCVFRNPETNSVICFPNPQHG